MKLSAASHLLLVGTGLGTSLASQQNNETLGGRSGSTGTLGPDSMGASSSSSPVSIDRIFLTVGGNSDQAPVVENFETLQECNSVKKSLVGDSTSSVKDDVQCVVVSLNGSEPVDESIYFTSGGNSDREPYIYKFGALKECVAVKKALQDDSTTSLDDNMRCVVIQRDKGDVADKKVYLTVGGNSDREPVIYPFDNLKECEAVQRAIDEDSTRSVKGDVKCDGRALPDSSSSESRAASRLPLTGLMLAAGLAIAKV